MLKALFGSKKFIVYLTAVITATAVLLGLPEEQAVQLAEWVVRLAMAYLGGQGLADLGKYGGQAIAKGLENGRTKPPSETPTNPGLT